MRNRSYLKFVALHIAVPTILFLPYWSQPVSTSATVTGEPTEGANSLVRNILHNEVEAQLHDQSMWCYKKLKVDGGNQKTFYVCQTKDGQIERLIAVNGQALDPEQVRTEDLRVRKFVSHPGVVREQHKKERRDNDEALNLLKIFPDAFSFQYAGMQENLVKLKFTPNPKFHPSSRPEEVFHHLEGILLLDAQKKRLASISGKLTSEVKFGGGLLGYLDRGGTFVVQQQEVAPGYWEVTMMRVQMNGKALFLKTISVHDDETYTDFKRLASDTNIQKAAELLKTEAGTRVASLR